MRIYSRTHPVDAILASTVIVWEDALVHVLHITLLGLGLATPRWHDALAERSSVAVHKLVHCMGGTEDTTHKGTRQACLSGYVAPD